MTKPSVVAKLEVNLMLAGQMKQETVDQLVSLLESKPNTMEQPWDNFKYDLLSDRITVTSKDSSESFEIIY